MRCEMTELSMWDVMSSEDYLRFIKRSTIFTLLVKLTIIINVLFYLISICLYRYAIKASTWAFFLHHFSCPKFPSRCSSFFLTFSRRCERRFMDDNKHFAFLRAHSIFLHLFLSIFPFPRLSASLTLTFIRLLAV